MLGCHRHNTCPFWLLRSGIVNSSAREILDLGPQCMVGPRYNTLIFTGVYAIAIHTPPSCPTRTTAATIWADARPHILVPRIKSEALVRTSI